MKLNFLLEYPNKFSIRCLKILQSIDSFAVLTNSDSVRKQKFHLTFWTSRKRNTRQSMMNGTSGSLGDSRESKMYFNAIDKAHEILESDPDLAQKVPSCVVVGMQSVGKSAILSRLSGICFPQDSEVCTRVAIELRLRRAVEAKKTLMIKTGNQDNIEVDKTDDGAVAKALKEAQNKVLNGKQFEQKRSVKVEKEDENILEVTLIDLPGVFFAKDAGSDDLEEQVKNMIFDRVQNEMALILHVVPLNQDTDTISTWRTVSDADVDQRRTISVLTKADLALKAGKSILEKRIQKILKDSESSKSFNDSESSKSFIVHGAARSIEEETTQLEKVEYCIEKLDLCHRVKVGISELKECIEDRMLNHIRQKIPDMRRMLEEELNRTTAKIEQLGREPLSPIRIATRDTMAIQLCMDKTYNEFHPHFRVLTERMTKEVFDIEMQPLGLIDATKVFKDLRKQKIDLDKNQQEDHLLALEIKKISDEFRSMINAPFDDKRRELQEWLKEFGHPLERILIQYIDDIFNDFLVKIIQPSIKEGSSEPTKKLAKRIEDIVQKGVVLTAMEDGNQHVNNLIESTRKNTYTANDHYLTTSKNEFEEKYRSDFKLLFRNSHMASMEPFFLTLCELRAFLKTRKKVLPDALQLHFSLRLEKLQEKVKETIEKHMLLESNVETIKESGHIKKKRENYLQREEKIKNALKEIMILT